LVNEDIFLTSQRVKKEVAGIFGEKVGHPRIDTPLCEFRGEEDTVSWEEGLELGLCHSHQAAVMGCSVSDLFCTVGLICCPCGLL